MGNLALKFACLTAKLQDVNLQQSKIHAESYLDLTPNGMFRRFYTGLNMEQRAALRFGFSETALLAILNSEFDFDPVQRDLRFKRASLNSRSLFLANLNENTPGDTLSTAFRDSLEHLTARFWQATRALYDTVLSPEREKELRSEMQECARQMLSRLHPSEYERYARMVSMRQFCFALTAEALFKCDAAAALFGSESAYTQAWKRKQIFRLMQAQMIAEPA